MTTRPIHPFLIAPLPLLYFLFVNLDQVSSLAAVRMVSLTMLGVAFIYGLAWLLLNHNPVRAGLVTSLFVLFWYSWTLFPLLFLAIPLAVLTVFVWKRKGRIELFITFFLNAISISLVVYMVIMITYTGLKRDLHIGSSHAATSNAADVYFIFMDSYSSPSVLQAHFGYNAQPMVKQLERLGFQVGECLSPSASTEDSLTAMLNGDPQLTYTYDRLVHSALRTTLEQHGYSTWAFSTGWIWTEFMDADRYYLPAYGPLTEFEAFALTTTPLSLLIDLDAARGNMTRLRTLTLVAHLADAATDPGAQFIFAHVVQPHPPFVFGPNGESLDPSAFENRTRNNGFPQRQDFLPDFYAKGYIGQLQYLEKVIPPILEQIVNAAPDSTIILTGDHGPWYAESDYEAHAVLCATRGLKALNALDAVNEIMGK